MYAGIAAFALMLILGISYKKKDLQIKKPTKKTTLLKGATTCVAGGLALYSAVKYAGAYAYLVCIALFICALADMLLERYFALGAFVFTLGHVFYIAAFITKGSLKWASVFIFVLLALLAYVLFLWAKKRTDKNIAPIMAYTLVLNFMLSQALFTEPLAAAGAFLFAVSDSLIGLRIVKGTGKTNEIACISLYYAAQYLLALSTIV
ncbi:MAG: lysoplasmalogenase family protein [Christensenellales bacterium]|jgi:uncharacterized membrane protein YhhN